MRGAPDILNADLGVEVNADNVSTAISGDYQATNTVHAVVRDLSKASAILASAVKAGGNETRLRGVLFAFDDDSRRLADARSRAFADAISRAEQYAVLAGLKLTDVVTINEVSSRDENPKTPARTGAADSFALEPGTQTVTFTESHLGPGLITASSAA